MYQLTFYCPCAIVFDNYLIETAEYSGGRLQPQDRPDLVYRGARFLFSSDCEPNGKLGYDSAPRNPTSSSEPGGGRHEG